MAVAVKKKKIISWVLVIIWMIVIFLFSSQTADDSSVLSGGISDRIIEVTEVVFPNVDTNEDIFHNAIRNTGHFFLYLVLGILLMNALNINNTKGYTPIIIRTKIISFLYAVSDEIHQIYVPGRSWEILDIIIDVLGAGAGILIYLVLIRNLAKNKEII